MAGEIGPDAVVSEKASQWVLTGRAREALPTSVQGSPMLSRAHARPAMTAACRPAANPRAEHGLENEPATAVVPASTSPFAFAMPPLRLRQPVAATREPAGSKVRSAS